MLSFEAVPASPILRLPLEKGPNGTQISLVAEEKSLLSPIGPELDSVRKRGDGLPVAADKRSTKVDPLEPVLLALQVCNLPDVVADGVKQAAADVLGLERGRRALPAAAAIVDLLPVLVG